MKFSQRCIAHNFHKRLFSNTDGELWGGQMTITTQPTNVVCKLFCLYMHCQNPLFSLSDEYILIIIQYISKVFFGELLIFYTVLRKISTEMVDFGLLKFDVKRRCFLNQGTLKGISL